MAHLRSIDYTLFFVIIALVLFGMIMISSVSVYPSFKVTSLMVELGKRDEASNSFYLLRSMAHVAIASVVLGVVAKVPYQLFERYAKPIFIAAIALLASVFVFGVTYNGARGWIDIPLVPFSLQPVEFAKIALVLYLASLIKRQGARMADMAEWFLPFAFIVGIVVSLLALQPDFGSILVIGPVVAVLFFIGGGNIRLLGLASLGAVALLLGVYFIGHASSPEHRNGLSYISDRIDNFLADNETAIANESINFQTKQWLIAIGSWGFFGLGFGNSIQKFGYLPEVQGDFIFSVIAEELGFVGVCILVGMYLFIVARGLSIAQAVQDPFAKYVAIGISSFIGTQAFINIGVNLNIVPLTGITLPFVSYGGSSLLALMFGIGILLNISRHADYERLEREMGNIISRRSVRF